MGDRRVLVRNAMIAKVADAKIKEKYLLKNLKLICRFRQDSLLRKA
jgi:hypothetical protein